MMQFLLIFFCGFWGGGCLCVCFPEHLRVILHSYSSRREGLRKNIISGYQVDTAPDPSSHNAPVAHFHRVAPYLHSCSPGIPLIYKSTERRTGMQSRGICMIFHCPTSLAVCKTNTVTCFGVVVSLFQCCGQPAALFVFNKETSGEESVNSLLSITSFTDSSDPKAVTCLTPFPNEWKCIQSGVEVGL